MMDDRVKRALVKIHGQNGPVGNGFLTDGSLIVTCAHVVADALEGCAEDQIAAPSGWVNVEFHFVQTQPSFRACIVSRGWFPRREAYTAVNDVAVLRLVGGPPADVLPLTLAQFEKTAGFEAISHPFFPSTGNSLPIEGRCFGPDEFKRTIFRAKEASSQFAELGNSGAPVFSRDGEVVIGIIEDLDKKMRQVFIRGASCLNQVLDAVRGSENESESNRKLKVSSTECATEFAREDLAQFEIFSPSQLDSGQNRVNICLALSFDQFNDLQPVFKSVVVEVNSASVMEKRLGVGKPFDHDGVTLSAFGTRSRPSWRISSNDGAPLLGAFEVVDPALGTLVEVSPGAKIEGLMKAPLRGISLDSSEEKLVASGKSPEMIRASKKIVKRLKLKALEKSAPMDSDGFINLGRCITKVEEV